MTERRAKTRRIEIYAINAGSHFVCRSTYYGDEGRIIGSTELGHHTTAHAAQSALRAAYLALKSELVRGTDGDTEISLQDLNVP